MAIALGLTVDGTPNIRTISIRFVDATGDKRAVSFPLFSGATDSAINAFVQEFATLTQAVIWSVEIKQVYGVVPTTAGATNDAHNSVFDNIVVLYKDGSGISTDLFIPAPIASLILAGDVVDVANTGFNSLTGALINAISTIGTPVTARFTERREINTTVPMP